MFDRDLTIFVNSCDSFQDCWDPFFTLFNRYWPTCNVNVLLNTEEATFQFKPISLENARVGLQTNGSRFHWSDCLKRALEKLTTPLVLYLQDDYFFDSRVGDHHILKLVELMRRDDS